MGSEYATDPSNILAGPSAAAQTLGVGRSGSALGGLLGPRSASSVRDGRSTDRGREGAGTLGFGGEDRGRKRRAAKGLVRVAVDGVREWVGETGEAMGLWKGQGRARRWQA